MAGNSFAPVVLSHPPAQDPAETMPFAIVVELLLGEIPDKATFRNSELRRALQPYFQLTQAVRTGIIMIRQSA